MDDAQVRSFLLHLMKQSISFSIHDAQNMVRVKQDVPMQRLGTPEEVADMILFVVTSGHYVTGQNFFVDGGLFMR